MWLRQRYPIGLNYQEIAGQARDEGVCEGHGMRSASGLRVETVRMEYTV